MFNINLVYLLPLITTIWTGTEGAHHHLQNRLANLQYPGNGNVPDNMSDNTNSSTGKLIFAHVLFRHGDRTPIDPYPNDPWGNLSFWPVGWGQLTNLGKQQSYHRGQWFRQRYQLLLGEQYSKDIIYIQSTDVDRTIMSAQSHLAGLFPPDAKQRWMDNIDWQPIPVHTVPEKLDYLLSAKKPCPAYDYALAKLKKSEEYRRIDKQYKPLYEYLSKYAGRKVNSMLSVQNLYNNLYIEDINNMTLPDWTKKVYFDGGDMQYLSFRSFLTSTYTKQLARIKSGFLLKEILNRFVNKTKYSLKPNRSVWYYSCHDTTIANLLHTLGLFEPHNPPYTATILMELRLLDTNPFVQVFYKNTTAEPKPLYIPNCGTLCPLEKMFELYDDVLPGDFNTECELPLLEMTYEDIDLNIPWAWTVVFVLLFLVVLFFIFSLILYQRDQFTSRRRYIRIDS